VRNSNSKVKKAQKRRFSAHAQKLAHASEI